MLGLKTDYTDRGMGSNGWGIGSQMTENGKGALLANPIFPIPETAACTRCRSPYPMSTTSTARG